MLKEIFEEKVTTEIVNNVPMVVHEKQGSLFTVISGTTGFKGGDTGHGGRSYFKLSGLESGDVSVNIKTNNFDKTESIEIIVGGDWEIEELIKAFEYAASTMRKQLDTETN